MLVYVLNRHGQPLMPCSARKARLLLKQKKAVVKKREPFTIQLLYGSAGYKQEISLGVDCGSKHIGMSATTKKRELYAADVTLRNDITGLISSRKESRHFRRGRLRYRKERYNNRGSMKIRGKFPPSIEQKIQTHIKVISDIYNILPVCRLILEIASFDIQKIKNPHIRKEQYQQGERLGFWNVREYVLFRDEHTCQCCKGKSKDPILNVHHIESRKTGGNAPNNLITLCETCHKGFHKGFVQLPKNLKRADSFRDASFMNQIKWELFDRLSNIYNNVNITYGYITKNIRVEHHLPKEHFIDARCISNNPDAKSLGYVFFLKKIRCQNRQIHKAKILKGGRKKLNQAPYKVFGFRLYDKVKFDNSICFIFGRRISGGFNLRKLNGEVIAKWANYKKIRFISCRRGYIQEIRKIEQ